MKTLIISNDPSIFIAESSARKRMREYAALLGELHIVSRSRRPVEEQEDSLCLHGIAGGRLFVLWRIKQIVRRLVQKHSIDVVSAQDPFEYGNIAYKAVEGTQAKLHIQVHTDFLSPWFVRSGNPRSAQVKMPVLNRVRRRLADKVLPHAAGIRVVSERVRDSLVARYGTRIPTPSVIPIYVSAEVPAPRSLPEHHYSFTLIAVSRLEPEKRIEDILHAIARLTLTYPGLGLMLVGEGSERRKLERMAAALGISEKITFLGWSTEARSLLPHAQAFIQASAYEGYGMSLIEAALARIPIITTDVGIVGEVLQGYDDVLAAPVGDPTALAVHIRTLIEDHRMRVLLVDNAERKVKAHLATLTNQPEQITEDLKRLIV